jgi:hypothetical protein
MQPSRILPDLQCTLLCEDVRQEVTGNFFLIGVINFIRIPQVPITAHRLLFFNRWTAGVGEFIQCIRLICPDQVTELSKSETKFALEEPASHAINVAVFGNVTFNTGGVYYVEVLVDNVMKIRFPLPIIVVPPANPNAPPPAPTTT